MEEKRLEGREKLLHRLESLLQELVSNIPSTSEPTLPEPLVTARRLTHEAAARAGLISGALSLPPGVLGLLTILPDLNQVWRIQRQLVADIAGVYGQTAWLGREQMLYCLFRHSAGQVVRQMAVRAGERALLQRATNEALERALRRIGIEVSERLAGRSLSRLVPIAGAIGIGAYAYYDTLRVGRTTIRLFQKALPTAGGEPRSPV